MGLTRQKSLILRGQPCTMQLLAGAGQRGHVGHVWHHVQDVKARATLKARPPDIISFYKRLKALAASPSELRIYWYFSPLNTWPYTARVVRSQRIWCPEHTVTFSRILLEVRQRYTTFKPLVTWQGSAKWNGPWLRGWLCELELI